MRLHQFLLAGLFSTACLGQEIPKDPNQQLREDVAKWVETMSRIQSKQSEWTRDSEVLANYKEGLTQEIESLNQSIKEAKTRNAGADSESLKLKAERDQYTDAKSKLAKKLREMEKAMQSQLGIFPKTLMTEPKVSQATADLKAALELPEDKLEENVSKRLLNLITLVSEAEKFQQTVHVRPELHTDQSGREFNMKVIYFGLAMAYAVNDEGTLALTGKPGSDGWVFEDAPTLISEIQRLIAATTGDAEAAFITLPFSKP